MDLAPSCSALCRTQDRIMMRYAPRKTELSCVVHNNVDGSPFRSIWRAPACDPYHIGTKIQASESPLLWLGGELNRIRELREAYGLTSDELAERVGTSGAQIRRLEQGVRRLTTDWMERLAEALQCSPADFIVHAVVANGQSEVEPVSDVTGAVARTMTRKGLDTYRITGVSLTAIGLNPGDIITVDGSAEAVASIEDGSVVLVQMHSPQTLVLRQYMRPGLLITNMPGANMAIRTEDRSVALQIVGVVLRD